ncbi:MAG: cytochrome c peroxidase [Gammaproteobacteria bacterium]|nr:cytochrome c peroxidase [Gammaproteobacteria bacterium]
MPKPASSTSYLAMFLTAAISIPVAANPAPEQLLDLGRMLYFDVNLSQHRTQSCATCHDPAAGFVDSRDNGVKAMASLGDDQQSLGDRQAPTAAYAAFSPDFHFDAKQQVFIGGQFWDGRTTNLAQQAGGPPLNPAEMAMPSKAAVVTRLQDNAAYRQMFIEHFGEHIWQQPEQAYSAMTQAIAAFEASPEVSPFNSKYDRYLAGQYELTGQEELGMALFFSNNNTNCHSCHMLRQPEQAKEPFSNYQFHNIGTPTNLQLRTKNGVAIDTVDQGLLANPAVTDPMHLGKFKVPTLRNIAITGPYMHNGVFAELSTVLAFYDQFNNPKRNLNPETGKPWRAAEAPTTVNHELLEAKALSDAKLAALEAFLRTLTDQRYEHLLH